MTLDEARALVEEGRRHRNAGRLDEGRVLLAEAVEAMKAMHSITPEDDAALRVEIAGVYWQLFLLEPYREDGYPWLDALRDVLGPLRMDGALSDETAQNLWDSATRVLGTCLIDFGPMTPEA